MAELKSWDVAAANNNDAAPDGAPEGMAPSAVNDVIRENMAVLARHKGDNDGSLDSGGSSNAYTLAPNGTYSAYTRGDTFTFEANHANTGSATLNVSSLGTKTLKYSSGDALIGGEIQSGGCYRVIYDGTDFLLLNPSIDPSTLYADNANQQIGVNTTAPSEALHVVGNALATGIHYSATGTFTVTSAGTTTEVIDGLADDAAYLVSVYCAGVNMELSLTGLVLTSNASVIVQVATLASGDFNVGSVALQTKGNASAFTFSSGNGKAFQFVMTGDGSADQTAVYRLLRIA